MARYNNDYGFSSQAGGARLINQDGSFNVVRRGIPFFKSFSVYHSLIKMSWPRFYAVVTAVFLFVNAVFSLLYMALGTAHLNGMSADVGWSRFTDAFFFSSQTLTTVGYGHIYPQGFLTSALAMMEAMFGLLGFAIATGLLFARFARPQAKILFSPQALVAPYRGGRALMFRMANARNHPLIEVEVQVGLALVRGEGENALRQFHGLSLERNSINFFPLTWTVVHPIDEGSPLSGADPEELKGWDAEFFVVVKAFDDGFNQTVHARFSYKPAEIVWGAKFTPAFGRADDGVTYVDLHRLGEFEAVSLPLGGVVGEAAGG